MKLSASNIAWEWSEDIEIYEYLSSNGFSGLEIAPTRIIANDPYSPQNVDLAKAKIQSIRDMWGIEISSMQSIWFGVANNIFGSDSDRRFLLNYMYKTIDYAHLVGCPNIVFGCPKNRVLTDNSKLHKGIDFFIEAASYAKEKNVTIGFEANPGIYGTNFVNKTRDAMTLVEEVNLSSFKINLDLGTIISNDEDISYVGDIINFISHVHISEPYLEPVKCRRIHLELAEILSQNGYDKYVSLEMKKTSKANLFNALDYVREIYG